MTNPHQKNIQQSKYIIRSNDLRFKKPPQTQTPKPNRKPNKFTQPFDRENPITWPEKNQAKKLQAEMSEMHFQAASADGPYNPHWKEW